jgi:hypothetical protein
MIRFRDKIEIKTDRNGNHSINTDLGQTFKTTQMNSGNIRTEWWNRQHQSELRRWQFDLLLSEFERLYRRINWSYEMQYYLVYQEGKGLSQPHDVVFAKIPQADLWIVGTANMSWLHKCDLENFSIHPNTAILGDISEKEERLRYYKEVVEPIEQFIRKKESVDA